MKKVQKLTIILKIRVQAKQIHKMADSQVDKKPCHDTAAAKQNAVQVNDTINSRSSNLISVCHSTAGRPFVRKRLQQ